MSFCVRGISAASLLVLLSFLKALKLMDTRSSPTILMSRLRRSAVLAVWVNSWPRPLKTIPIMKQGSVFLVIFYAEDLRRPLTVSLVRALGLRPWSSSKSISLVKWRALRENKIRFVDMEEAVSQRKLVNMDLVEIANVFSTKN